jgi:tRNA-specific 2-thiouridylase
MKKTKKRVVLGMSGGVDSSVAAALLKKRGYDVIGITMQMLPQDHEKQSACCNLSSVNDAKRVCSKLKIPHYTINIRENFKHHVIDPFVNQYLQGQTPNPCVECNRHIKFDELEEKAKELGADFVATGHYCKRTYSTHKKEHLLRKAKDPNKDQTYFLYMLTAEKLKTTLFPLGNLLKTEIRALAHSFGLVNASKPESQEICFVTGKTYKDFIAEQVKDRVIPEGDIVHIDGTILGRHKGIHTVTLGQRKGLGIAHPEPLYVLKINPVTHQVIVGPKESMSSGTLTLTKISLVNEKEPLIGREFNVKSRYNMTPFVGRVDSFDGETLVLSLPIKQTFITPGQSGVLYDKDRVIGGGIIQV